jgi:hypothetical protein
MFKNILKHSSIVAIAIVTLVTGMLVGCQKEEVINDDMPYLEISSNISNLTESDIKILGLAKERIEKYVNSESGIFELTVNSAKQINVSEELFEYFNNTIKQANSLIQNTGYVISENRLIKKGQLIPRIKSGSENGSSYNSGIEFTWYGLAIHVSSQDVGWFSTELRAASFISGMSVQEYHKLMQHLEVVPGLMGIFVSSYDRGNGFSIICPLYVPTYIQTH